MVELPGSKFSTRRVQIINLIFNLALSQKQQHKKMALI
jgi:hypothetical protein